MMTAVQGPQGDLWRVERKNRPQSLIEPTGSEWRVMYFAESAVDALMESLWPLRPSPSLAALVEDEWESRGWNLHQLSSEWLRQRQLVRFRIDQPAFFLDAANMRPINPSRRSDLLALARHGEVDGNATDSKKAFAGLRYASRIPPGSFLWAAFEDRVTTHRISEQELTPDLPQAVEAASRLSLTWS